MKNWLMYPFACLLLVVASACSMRVEVAFDLETFEREQQAWNDAKIAKYEYIYEEVDFETTVYEVNVDGDKCKVTDVKTKETRLDDNYRIENIYKRIRKAYDASQDAKIAPLDYCLYNDFFISIQYDEINHVPLSSIVCTYEAPNVGYEIFACEVNNFKIPTN